MDKEILIYLLSNEFYFNKVFPILKIDYFDHPYSKFFGLLLNVVKQIKKFPKLGDIKMEIVSIKDKRSKEDYETIVNVFKDIVTQIKLMKEDPDFVIDLTFILNKTEEFIRQKALLKAISTSIDIISNPKEKNLEQIESLIKNALTIKLDDNDDVHFDDLNKRVFLYSEKRQNYPVLDEEINEMIGGGFEKNAIYVFLGATGIGKSLLFSSLAVELLKKKYNVVYLTAELSDKNILQRIDANMFDIDINEIKKMSADQVRSTFESCVNYPNLIIKNVPNGTVSSLQVENYIRELEMNGFKTDFLILDYLNLFNSISLSSSNKSDSYTYYKVVTEEFRKVAQDLNICIITGSQLNREGSKKKNASDVSITDISESYGVSSTADFQCALFQNPFLREERILLMKVLKSRFFDNTFQIYKFNIDYRKMRITKLDDELPISLTEESNKVKNEKDLTNFSNDDDFDF